MSKRSAFVKEDVTLATTRADIEASDELQQLKALIADQQQRLEALEAHSGSQNGDANGDTKEKSSTRRQMLKLAGATLIGAAGGAALRAIPAAANDGDIVQVGNVYTETAGFATGINGSSSAFNIAVYGGAGYAGYGVLGGSGTYGSAVVGNGGYGGIGVRGQGNTTYGTGVRATGHEGVLAYGSGGGYGVFAAAGPGTGVFGSGNIGVYAYTSSTGTRALYAYTGASSSVAIQAKQVNPGGIFSGAAPAISAESDKAMGILTYGYLGGIWGSSSSSFSSGVVAFGYSGGPDLKLHGSGRLVQIANISGGVGAPNFTSKAGYFEMVRAKDGAMWINRGTGALQASWKRLNAVRADSADGTGNPFKPFRVKDTRTGGANRRPVGSLTVVTVAGTGTGTSSIPSDAVAVIGNLTATAYTGSGWLSIMPAGIPVGTGPTDYYPHRDPSSVNFIVGQAAIANSFVCGLDNLGRLQVYVAGHPSHFIIDITGYLQ